MRVTSSKHTHVINGETQARVPGKRDAVAADPSNAFDFSQP